MPSSAECKPIKATQVRIAAERFYVLLEDGRELGIPYDWYWRLAEATPEELNNWRLIAGGQGISWEDLDEDLSVLGLLEGRRKSKREIFLNDAVKWSFSSSTVAWLPVFSPFLYSKSSYFYSLNLILLLYLYFVHAILV